MVSSQEWISAFANELGVEPPSDDEREAILSLAATAAHASDRTAAPVACWLAARAGVAAQEAHRVAQRVLEAGPGEGSSPVDEN